MMHFFDLMGVDVHAKQRCLRPNTRSTVGREEAHASVGGAARLNLGMPAEVVLQLFGDQGPLLDHRNACR